MEKTSPKKKTPKETVYFPHVWEIKKIIEETNTLLFVLSKSLLIASFAYYNTENSSNKKHPNQTLKPK